MALMEAFIAFHKACYAILLQIGLMSLIWINRTCLAGRTGALRRPV
jgi:hypothetical protein